MFECQSLVSNELMTDLKKWVGQRLMGLMFCHRFLPCITDEVRPVQKLNEVQKSIVNQTLEMVGPDLDSMAPK